MGKRIYVNGGILITTPFLHIRMQGHHTISLLKILKL